MILVVSLVGAGIGFVLLQSWFLGPLGDYNRQIDSLTADVEGKEQQYTGILRDLVHSAEPTVKDYANDAIARSIKEGKGTLGAEALFKMLGAATPKETKKVAPTTQP